MKIAILDGSPKFKNSNSNYLIDYICNRLDKEDTYDKIKLIVKNKWEEYFKTISKSDVLLIVVPLYVDGLPAHVLEFLYSLQDYIKQNGSLKADLRVYSICQCGMYEGTQNEIAISIINNWCEKNHIQKGQGIGIGTGTLLATKIKAPFLNSSKKEMKKLLNELKDTMKKKEVKEEIYYTSRISRWYCIKLSHMYWYVCALKNKLRIKQLFMK